MLELQHIGKHWHAQRHSVRVLLQDISLRVARGTTVAILGPSGSGKSTLLKMVAGLEPPDHGRVLFDGQDITAMPPERRHFGMMFQDFALFAHLSVQDNVAFGLIERRIPRVQARAQAVAMLERFGMAAFASQRIWRLSGGEQQRVALARALVTQPRVLLLDEPFSALDAKLRVRLRAEFTQHIAAHAVPTVWVTHDESEARAVAQTGYRLEQCQLVALWGAPEPR